MVQINYSLGFRINAILELSTQINTTCKITEIPLVLCDGFCENFSKIGLSFIVGRSELAIFVRQVLYFIVAIIF